MIDYFKVIIFTTLANMCCFLLGAIVTQKTQKGEKIKVPTINPIRTIKEFNADKETQKEIERDRIINENIDNYNGTSIGQQNIPR